MKNRQYDQSLQFYEQMYMDTDTDTDTDCTDRGRLNGITIQLYHLNDPKVYTDTYTYIEVLLKAKRTIQIYSSLTKSEILSTDINKNKHRHVH